MSATTLFVIGIVAAAGLAALAVFTVAWRRGPSAEPITAPTTGKLDKRAVRSDRRRQTSASVGGGTAVATLTKTDEADTAPEPEATADATAPPSDPALQKIPITAAEYGVTRRKFLNRALFGLFVGAFLGGLSLSFLAFLWPKLKGGFGSAVNAGNFNDIQSQLIQPDGSIQPIFMAAAQSWIVPFETGLQDASSFTGLPVVATDGSEPGVMALWQRCVHLGCRVPECLSSQGFECPCHGSKYNFHGEYEDGPAPRNMDRFAVEVNDNGDLIIQTGQVVETSRATAKTIAYPQGPSCL
jgi:cytochrome b6-f complex iron-sulfur subunit